MSQQSIEAVYFDGKSSQPQLISIALCEGGLSLEGAGWGQVVPVESLVISEPLGEAPRLLYLSDGGYCEVRDKAGLDGLLASLGAREGHASRWGRSTRLAIMALLAIALAGFLGFQYGIPWAAERLAQVMPASMADSIGKGTLAALDRALFNPSELSEVRQQALRENYAALALAPGPILFRRSAAVGPNALALPDNSIVLTDELVKLAGSDQEIMAVIAHESGHIANRDHLQAIIRSTLVGSIMTLWLGDVNFMIATVPAALLNARYSREAELAADDHAAAILKRNGLSPELLGRLLERIEASLKKDPHADEQQGLLDSHPLTRERMARMRGAPANDHAR